MVVGERGGPDVVVLGRVRVEDVHGAILLGGRRLGAVVLLLGLVLQVEKSQARLFFSPPFYRSSCRLSWQDSQNLATSQRTKFVVLRKKAKLQTSVMPMP